ncbi:SCO family protein [Daejeonella sp.]|jgi:protein SCO1/2|uniref:SCO family protein n=1 Tax=Daejeonella sp. TaxID=2805397 RepID=UPI0037847912
MYRIVFLLLSSFLLWGCLEKKPEPLALPYYNEPDFTPLFIKEKSDVAKKVTHKIGNFSLLNQDSIYITHKNIEGKIHVANFIFTSCGSICPVITKNMKIVSDTLKGNKDIVFLSYSVTPWIDKPFVLKKFKERNSIKNPNWQFLTGNKSDIYKLARQSYFAEENIGFSKDSTEFLHTEHFILVDRAKRIRGIYNGTLSLEMQQLIEDIKTLEKENLSL